jgi:glycerol-3-phosphate dehydrogenase subunit C
MSVNPAYDPTDPRYYDGKDLRAETERIFSVCADCRLCVRYCGSFPKLFDAIDSYCTDEQYSEVDAKKLKIGDVDEIVDLCFQCKLCYIKCPSHSRRSRLGHRLSPAHGPSQGQKRERPRRAVCR